MLNKNLEENQIIIALQEVKDAMKSSCESANVLDEKTHSVIKVILSIIFGLSVVIFIYDSSSQILWPACILMFGAFVSLIILCFGYTAGKYHLYGDLMNDIEKEDFYYHDYKGMLIYLIKTYQIKIEGNAKINAIKGALVNWSIITAIFFAIVAVVTYFCL
jgi:uncharacterized membrane protein